MAERDVVVQLKPSEAKLLLLALRSNQELLDITADFIPGAAHYAEERTQQLSKLRALMYRIHDAPTTEEYTPREVGGVLLIQYQSGRVLAWGPNMEYITGWTEDEMRGKVGWQMMGLTDTRVEAFLEQLQSEMVIKQETELPTKWGKHTRVFFRAELVEDQHRAIRVEDKHKVECSVHYILAHVWPI